MISLLEFKRRHTAVNRRSHLREVLLVKKHRPVTSPEVPCDLPTRIEKMDGALTVPELAELLWLGRTAIYDMVNRGVIPHMRIGGSIRFDPIVLARWIRERSISGAGGRKAA